MRLLSEALKIDDAVLPVSSAVVQNPSAYFDMQDYNSALIIVTATLASGESVSVQAREAEDAAGTGVADLGDAIVLDSVANPIVYIEVKAGALTDGSQFLGVELTPTGTVEMQAIIIRGKARYEAVTQVVDTSSVIDGT